VADRVVNIITPATNYDLITLDELKLMFGIPVSDTIQDELYNQYITIYSDMISEYCNRTFAYEELYEIWRCVEYDQTNAMKRLFLSHYPLDDTYSIIVESPTGGVIDSSEYEIEWKSGKIELLGTNTEPIKVTYAGGYNLPDEAPPALKQAVALAIRENQAYMQRLGVSGIRSISHKDSRVMYFDIVQGQQKGQGPFGSTAAGDLLSHYVRLEV
jgi:hypothetical protein